MLWFYDDYNAKFIMMRSPVVTTLRVPFTAKDCRVNLVFCIERHFINKIL